MKIFDQIFQRWRDIPEPYKSVYHEPKPYAPFASYEDEQRWLKLYQRQRLEARRRKHRPNRKVNRNVV